MSGFTKRWVASQDGGGCLTVPRAIGLCVALIVGALLLVARSLLAADDGPEYGQKNWFDSGLPTPGAVLRWTEAERDERLQILSRWTLSKDHWVEFVGHSTAGLGLPADKATPFTFAEIGVGVGAFARVLMKEYPASRLYGVDLVPRAVDIARVVLPRDRSVLEVADATDLSVIPSDVANYVLVPGVICYLKTRAQMLAALSEVVRIAAASGATATFTMIPEREEGRMSCASIIPRAFWSSPEVAALGIVPLSFSSMSDWACCGKHGPHRYAAFVKIIKPAVAGAGGVAGAAGQPALRG